MNVLLLPNFRIMDKSESDADRACLTSPLFFPIILRLARTAIYRGFDLEFRKGLANVTDVYLGLLMNTEDSKEGLRAFLEKRKPVWKGK